MSFSKIIEDAKNGKFEEIEGWLKNNPLEVNRSNTNGWTVLHYLAQAESDKKISDPAITNIAKELFKAGANIHQSAAPLKDQKIGDTAFNVAASASPIIGRLMTNHWLEQALAKRGEKKINDKSGSHGSTLAQYIAKWSNASEIGYQLDAAMEAGMDIAVQNASGWTPLHAAAAMIGRSHAVEAFKKRYTPTQLQLKTGGDPYSTIYSESPDRISYGDSLTAAGVAKARLTQAKRLPNAMKDELKGYIKIIGPDNSIDKPNTAPKAPVHQAPPK